MTELVFISRYHMYINLRFILFCFSFRVEGNREALVGSSLSFCWIISVVCECRIESQLKVNL